MPIAANSETHSIFSSTVIIVILIGGLIYTFGYRRAVMNRARVDYKTTKASVPVLRKAFWRLVLATFKTGLIVALVAAALLLALFKSSGSDEPGATVSPSVSPSPRR